MSDYSQKLVALAEKEKKLLEEKTKLLNERKSEIGNLAERCNIVLASDEVIAGIFLQLKQALENKSEKLQEWETLGRDFSNPASAGKKLKQVNLSLVRLAQKKARFRMIDRKQDTRRKIQLGGLVIKAHLDHLPTATLLGLLLEAAELLETTEQKEVLSRWRLKGDIVLTQDKLK